MILTPAQLQAIKADITANSDLNVFPNNSDGSSAIAALYNLPAVGPFFVWNTAVDVGLIYDAIVWANLTPNDLADTTQIWENRAMMCQLKQINLQIMLQGKATLNCSRANVRAGLNDALTAIPSGTNGAPRAAGWTAVQPVLARPATRLEKLFANTAGGNGATATTAALMVVEGSIAYQDIDSARAS
jgi:hypothetical protein